MSLSFRQNRTQHDEAYCDPALSREQGFSGACSKGDDELDALLFLVEKDSSFTVEKVLKESSYEETQIVSAQDCREGGAHKHTASLFIRKYLDQSAGLGLVYKRLLKACQSVQRFEHLPFIYDCYELNDKLVVIMEYVQGETLREVVYRCGPSVELTIDIFPRICDAVRELHELFEPPIIHRDLKPSNIIISFNRVTLIDFGIARTYRDGSSTDTVRFGTREYAPPEQFGFGQTDVRSDVYSLGILLYYCFTEEVPDAQTRSSNFASALIPEVFRRIIVKACSFDPEARFASVKDFQQAFLETAAAYTIPDTSDRQRSAGMVPKRPLFARRVYDERGDTASCERCKSRSAATLFSNMVTPLCAKIPAWIGRVWNALLLAFFALLTVAVILAVINPTEQNAQYPVWYLVLEYFIFVLVSWGSITYAFLDKRRWFQKHPSFKKMSFPMRFFVFVLLVPVAMTCLLVIGALIVGVV